MLRDGVSVNLGDLLGSNVLERARRYAMTSQQRRGLANDQAEVGLDGSTRSWVTPNTWGSVQRSGDIFNTRSSSPQRLVTGMSNKS